MPSKSERYWGSICLGIVTIATAAIGVALFNSGLVDAQIPEGGPLIFIVLVVKYGSAVLAIGFYLAVLYSASRIIVPSPAGLHKDSTTIAKRVFWVYALFVCELLALLVLLAVPLAQFLGPARYAGGADGVIARLLNRCPPAMPGAANRNAITAVILAGGQSRRLGRDKALEPFGGEPLLCRVIRRAAAGVNAGVGNVVVVVADAARTAALPLAPGQRTAVDAFPGSGPLGGIYTGLAAARTDWSLVVACDLPFLSPPLLRYLAGLRHGVDADAIAPVIDGRPEPTHALYSRRCRPAIAARIQAGQLKAADLFNDVAVRYVDETEMRRFDPDLLSFFNINRPADLTRALELAQYEDQDK